MIRNKRALVLFAALAVVFSGCNLLKTEDGENVSTGAGAQSFNPYGSTGAIRMALQNYNGCAVSMNGIPYGAGNTSIPYPASCYSYDVFAYPYRPWSKTPPMPVLTGTQYFLGQLTLENQIFHVPAAGLTGPDNVQAAVNWMEKDSEFASLDWSNLSQLWDLNTPETAPDPNPPREHVVMMNGANWMIRHNDTNTDWQFKVEVVDEGGKVVGGPVVYNRADFMAENPVSLHTQVMWEQYNVTAPKFPGDTNLQAADPTLPFPYDMTTIRIDLEGSTNPFKTFTIAQGLTGDGAIRVTWSEMPQKPFYFPVSFVASTLSNGKAVVPGSTCYKEDGTKTPCAFGLNPTVSLSTPANGKYYMPGESFTVKLGMKDSAGNLINAPDALPSWATYKQAQGLPGELATGGLGVQDVAYEAIYRETDHLPEVKIAGPLQDMRPVYSTVGLSDTEPFFSWPDPANLVLPSVGFTLPGMDTAPTPTSRTVDLPADAKPGTYVVLLKANRHFLGERVNKINAFYFQVGQDKPTSYPGRVGNCQVCHRSVISLDNLLHGLSVNNIEACKACHTIRQQPGGVSPLLTLLHRIHMSSDKYPLPKRECVVCHLTKESALRPSLAVCGACHESIHGDRFYAMENSTDPTNNAYSNCAQACHVVNPPALHELPEN